MKTARSLAALSGRGFVVPDDVKESAGVALRHRIVVSPELWMRERAAEDVVDSIIASVPVPVIAQS